MTIDMTRYRLRNVLWGRTLPSIDIYDENWGLIAHWQLRKQDNFRMDMRFPEELAGKHEMENGRIRKRIRGYRMYVDFHISNVENRDLLNFLRKMWGAAHVIILPHNGEMKNPDHNVYSFEVHVDSGFAPKYFDGRFIGHTIDFSLEAIDLLSTLPEDDVIMLVKAESKIVDGVEVADERTSMTFWGEKLYYGGWERTAEDLKYVAFWEEPDEDEIEPYGKLW